MARPPSSESQHLANDESTQDFEPHSSLQFEEDDHHMADVTGRIPTKAVEEDKALFDGDRPVSAGTVYGTEYDDFDHYSDDEAVVAKYSIENEHEITQPTYAPDSGVHGLLVKPEMSQPLEIYTHFQFSPGNQQPMPSAPSRPLQPSNAMPTPYPTEHENEVHNEHTRPTHQPDHSERKRKKTKNRKSQQPKLQEDTVELPDDTAVGRDIVLDTNADRSGKHSPTLHPPQAMDLDQEQNTEDLEAVYDVRHHSEDSPHGQLQNEFEAAAEPERQLSEGPSVATRQVFQRIEVEHEVREPSAVHEINAQPPQDQHESASRAISRNSDQPTHSTAQKRKSKSSRKAAPAHQKQSAAARVWTTPDYVELLKLKIQEEEQARMAAFTAELEASRVDVNSATEARTAIQSELDSVLEQEQRLTGTIELQQTKIVNYERKFRQFKTFVDGLGKDLDSLKKDANSQRRRNDDIAQEVESQSNRNLAAYLELDERAKDYRKFKDKALKLAQDKDAELQQVLNRQDQLERDRNNAIQDFDKLRARCSDLEQQLKAAKDPSDGLVRSLKSNHDALMDKLHLVHASTEEQQKMNGITELIERLDSASNTISSSTSSANEDIAHIKTLVEALDQRLNNSIEAADAAGLNVRAHFDEAVKSLHSQLADRERLLENHRDIVNSLQEQLNACNVRVANEEAQKAAAHGEASGLKEQNAVLETKVSALQNKVSPAENAHLQLNETKADLEKTNRALDSAKTDLESKAEQLGALTIANTTLEEQLKALENRLQDTQKSKDHSEPQHEELARKVQEAEQRTRKEMADHIENFETQLKAKANNEVKKLTSEKSRLEKQIKPLQEELASSNHLITQMQTDKSAASDALKQELERTKKHSQSLQDEIEALQSSLNDLKASSMASKDVQEKLSTLSAQFTAEKTKLKQTTEQNAELLQQVKRLGQAKEEIELAKEQAKADLADLRRENESQVDILQKELDEAKDDAENAAAGLEHYKESCRKSIDDASEKGDRKVQALQKRLSEAQAELKKEKEDGEKFRNDVEEKWLQEQQTFKEDLEASNKKASDAEARTLEAKASAERRLRQEFQTTMDEQHASLAALQEQLEQERKRTEAAEEKLKSQQRPSSEDSKTSSYIKVPNTRDGITPTTNITPTVPPKVRKKADRNKHATNEVGVVPAPEEIRPDSRKTNSATDRTATKGPVVEESQFVSDAFAIKHGGSATLDRDQCSFSTVTDNDTLHHQNGSSQALPHTVPETQLEDTLPSFAAVHRSLSSTQAAPLLPPSTSFSAFAEREFNGISSNEDIASNDFKVYEDVHERERSSELQYSRAERHRRANESWSQEEKAKYTYQKPMPLPNSASKMVHSHNRHPNHAGRNSPGVQQRAEPAQDTYKTPNPDTGVSNDLGNPAQPSSASSSSPVFMQAKHSNRRQSTYRTPQPSVGYITDPRLAGRNDQAGTKRKADNDIVEGYERERKKRSGVTANNLGRDERRDRSQQLQSIKDLPGMKAGQKSSQTRMQNLAGGSSRPTRPAKKMTKTDEYDLRFSQELGRR